jgi:hypothetical protein
MKQYCQICNFFKEDTVPRDHPQLQAKGVKWTIVLCDVCYEGLKQRKTRMKDWVQQKVCVPYNTKGPEGRIDDTIHLHITMMETVELAHVEFETTLNNGYVWGKLVSYDYQHRERSLIDWQPILFVMSDDVRRTYSFVTSDGKKIHTARKFVLYNKKGYIQ